VLSKNQISSLTSLHQKKFRWQTGTFLAEGDKIVRDALRSDFEVLAVYGTGNKLEEFGEFLHGRAVHTVDEKDLEKISTLATPQQILAVVAMKDQHDEIDFSCGLKLVLDGIKDPGNLGTLIRIADWFGIEELICSEDSVECYNPKVIQSAMGSLFREKIFYKKLELVFEENRSGKNLPVFGTLLNGESVFKNKLSRDGFIILGNESEGITPGVKKFITTALTIPGYSKSSSGPDSLNVAVAAGIICSQFRAKISG
jgi:RNA methyltransferase, TrmH family